MPFFAAKEVRAGDASSTLGVEMFSRTEAFQLSDRQRGRLLVETARLGPLEIARVRSTGHRISLSETDKFTFLAPVSGQISVGTTDVDYCGSQAAALLFSPNRRTTFVRAPQGALFVAHVLLASKQTLLDGADRAGLRWRRSGVALDLAKADHKPSVQSIRRYLACVTAEFSEPSSLFNRTAPRVTAGELAMEHLFQLLLDCEVLVDEDAGAATSSRHVRTAEAYMRAHFSGISSMLEVAEAVGVGIRSLQMSFKSLRGVSPRQALTRIRLQEARQRLTAPIDAMSVTQVALACGFAHLGRFAQQYRRVYGESPSTTLNQRTA